MMIGASNQKSTTTRSAAGGAGGFVETPKAVADVIVVGACTDGDETKARGKRQEAGSP